MLRACWETNFCCKVNYLTPHTGIQSYITHVSNLTPHSDIQSYTTHRFPFLHHTQASILTPHTGIHSYTTHRYPILSNMLGIIVWLSSLNIGSYLKSNSTG